MEIYLDACIAIYLVEEHPAYAPLVAARLRGGVGRIAYSPLVEMECLVLPMRQQRIELVRRFRGFFALNHRLAIGDEVFRIATELRARHGIKTPDALQPQCTMVAASSGPTMIASMRWRKKWRSTCFLRRLRDKNEKR